MIAYFYFVFHVHDKIQEEQIEKWWPRGRVVFLALLWILLFAIAETIHAYTLLYEDAIDAWWSTNHPDEIPDRKYGIMLRHWSSPLVLVFASVVFIHWSFWKIL